MIKIVKVVAVLLVFTLIGVEANAQTDPQIRVVVIPMGGDEGPTFKTIFVTPETFDGDFKDEIKGDLDGPSGADRLCMEFAELPDSKVKGKTFKAWLSNGIGTVSDYAYFRPFAIHNLPYHNTNNEILFDNLDDFDVIPQHDFTTHTGVSVLVGDPLYYEYPWTGINSNGTTDPTLTCDNWEDSTALGSYGELGVLAAGAWTASNWGSCSDRGSLLCVEQ